MDFVAEYHNNTAFQIIFTLAVLLLIVGIYFIPSLLAREKHKRNRAAIFALNFFLGWTFVGWVVALVWAMTKDDPVKQ